MDSIFFEKQEGSLCAQHCLNTLLQGPYFTAVDLAAIAQELDEAEMEKMAEGDTSSPEYLAFLEQSSSNMDDSGFFSIQVICNALKIWGLKLITYSSPEAETARSHPEKEKAFICNLRQHWFTIRKLGNQWFNLNSLLSGSELLTETYLHMFLTQLQTEGYSIFVVKGCSLPSCHADQVLLHNPVKYVPKKPKPKASKQPSGGYQLVNKSQLEQALSQASSSPAKPVDVDEVRRKRALYFESQGEAKECNNKTETTTKSDQSEETDDLTEEEMLQVALQMSLSST